VLQTCINSATWDFEPMPLKTLMQSLLTPRMSPIITAGILCALIGVYLNAYLVLPRFIQKNMYSMLSTERDDYGHISYVLSHLPQKPYQGIFTIGGSGMREALPATTIFERQLNLSLQAPVLFENLSAFGQSLSESLEITAHIIKQGYAKKGSLFVISINPRRFTESPEEAISLCHTPRLPLISCDAMHHFLSEQHYTLQWYPNFLRQQLAIRHYLEGRLTHRFKTAITQLSRLECGSTCLKSLVNYNPFHEPNHYFQFAYPDKSMPESAKLNMQAQLKNLRVPKFNENVHFSMQVLEQLIHLVQSNGYEIMLVDLPRAPESYIGYQSIEKKYQLLINKLKQKNITYINLDDEAHFLSSNFYDLDHLRPKSRPIIASRLIKLINQNELKKG
jgi:hypothetical protein